MVTDFLEFLTMDFAVRALVVGLLLSFCAALLGVCLVPKRYSMIGDGLSHVGFGALAVASVLGAAPLAVALPVVVLASFLLLRLRENGKIKGDSAIAMISAGALAVGVMVVSLSGSNTDLDSYMFGSILAVTTADIVMSLLLCAVVIVVYILFYNRIFIITCDEPFAKASGINVSMYRFLIAFLTALTIVMGMRMMGSLLISSLIIFPAVTARNFASSFKSLVITSGVCSVICFIIGIALTICFNLPTGAGIVVVNAFAMIISSIYGKVVKKG